MKTVHKPWGREEWMELNDKYCYKRIYINKGFRTSFQYHNQKLETNCLISGEAELWLENDSGQIIKSIMASGDFITIPPLKKHRIVAITDIVLYEVSTPEVDDVIRIDDDSHRKSGKIDSEHQSVANDLTTVKNINESVYKINNSVVKTLCSNKIAENKFRVWTRLRKYCPNNLTKEGKTITYDWIEGRNLYEVNSLETYVGFLKFLDELIANSKKWCDEVLIKKFYHEKTRLRINEFLGLYGSKYFTHRLIINNKQYSPISNPVLNISQLQFLYSNFHGDLHFNNIILNESGEFKYVDWRESFSDNTSGGDIYYDLAKLYAGCIFPFNLFKNKSLIDFSENDNRINYKYPISPVLSQFRKEYELWITNMGFSLPLVKKITSFIFLNISPLHEEIFNKIFLSLHVELINNE